MPIQLYKENFAEWTNNWTVRDARDVVTKDTDSVGNGFVVMRVKSDPIKSDYSSPTSYSHGRIIRTLTPYDENNDDGFGDTDFLKGQLIGSVESVLVDVVGPNFAVNYYSTNSFNRVQTECMAKLGTGDLNLGVAIAETLQTTNLVTDLAQDVLGALVAVKRGDVKYLKKKFSQVRDAPAQTLAERWLQYSLGIKPMVSDLKAAADLHDKGIVERHADPLTLKATRNISQDFHETLGDLSNKGTETWHCTIEAEISDRELHGQNVLGLRDLKSVVWELVPYSFVIDYVAPIGTMLQALNAPIGLTFTRGWVSVQGSEVIKNKVQLSTPSKAVGQPVEIVSNVTSFRRIALSEFPSPRLYFKNPVSVTHAANVLSLLYLAR